MLTLAASSFLSGRAKEHSIDVQGQQMGGARCQSQGPLYWGSTRFLSSARSGLLLCALLWNWVMCPLSQEARICPSVFAGEVQGDRELGTNTLLVSRQRLPQTALIAVVLVFVLQLPVRFPGDTAWPEGSLETWRAGFLSKLAPWRWF